MDMGPSSSFLPLATQQAKEEEKKCLAEAARLSREVGTREKVHLHMPAMSSPRALSSCNAKVQMAEHARRWLANVDENTKMFIT